MNWDTLFAAIALVFILEGLLPFLIPDGWRKMMLDIAQMKTSQIRIFGFVMMLIGWALLSFFS